MQFDFLKRMKDSGGELKKINVLTACAMLGALAVVMSNFTVDVTPQLRVGFSMIPNQIVDYLFGPVTGAIFGGVLDVLKFAIKPTGPFFFGFTFDAMLAAFIYGMFFYKRKLSFWRVLIAEGLVALIVNIGFNTLWLSVLYGKGFFALLPARALKNIIMWPINTAIFYFLAQMLGRAGIFRTFRDEMPAGPAGKGE